MTANPSKVLFLPFQRTLHLEGRKIVIEENVIVRAHPSPIPSVEALWIPPVVEKLNDLI